VAGLAFSPDSRQLASVSFDKTVRLWAPRSGQALPAPAAAQKVSYPLRAVAYSPKGGLLAFAGGDGSDAGVQILSLDAGATRPRSATATKIVSSLAFSPDGRQLAAGTWDRQVLLLPTDGSGATSTLRSPGGAVLAVAYAPSGEWLASATEYSGLFLWSPQPTPALQLGSVRADNGQALTSLAVSPDGKLLVAGGIDKAVHRFARMDGQLRELRPLTGAPDVVAAVALSPDGQRLAAATGNEVRLFRADNGQPLGQPLGHKGVVVAVAFDPSSSRLAASTFDGDLQLWNVTDGQPLGPPLRGHTQAVWGLAFSRDGSRLCSASQDVTLRIWDSGRGTELAQVGKGHALALTACAFSPRGDLVVTASEDSTLRVWEIDEPPPPPPPSAAQANAPRASISGALAMRPRGEPLRGHAGKVRQLAISADGQRVLSVGEDQQLRLWDLPTQTLIGAIGDSPALLNAVALLPGDQQAATVGEDGALRLWQLDAGAWARLCCQRAGRDLSPREQALFLGGLQDLGKEPLGRLCAQE
jgi:WD40 repeat protein